MLAAALAGVVAALVTVLGLGVSTVLADSCPNAQFRTGYSANLPDCRAYEQVTPASKDSSEVRIWADSPPTLTDDFAASDGSSFAYFSMSPQPEASTFGNYYLAARGTGGWTSATLIPRQSTNGGVLGCAPAVDHETADLSSGVLADGSDNPLCSVADPPLVAGEPQGVQNLFVRDNDTGSYRLVSVNPVTGAPADAFFQGGSADFGHVVFQEAAQLTSDAPPAPSGSWNLYDWAGGAVRLVSQIPSAGASCSGSGCTPVAGQAPHVGGFASGWSDQGFQRHAVSADGSRIFFTVFGTDTNSPPNGLYVREDGTTTAQLDAPAPGAPGPGGGGVFQNATDDGLQAYFTDDASAGLTVDTQSGSGANLYGYDVGTGTLTDLTPGSDARVEGVVATSADGSDVYFVADGVLAANANSHGDTATSGEPNLYLRRDGTTTFIATLSIQLDACDWNAPNVACPPIAGYHDNTARVTPDGAHLAFNSVRRLTGYDNTPTDPSDCTDAFANPLPCTEVFLYDAASGKLTCASCNPSGASPVGSSWIPGRGVIPPDGLVDHFSLLPQNLSSDGSRLFFDSTDALVPGDGNGNEDVYEYEGGQVHLISSGTSAEPAVFVGASSSGNDVFFTTYQQLVAQDGDDVIDVYDARVDGGLASQQQTPSTPCSGDGCKGPVGVAPTVPAAASIAFFGPGNATPSLPAANSTVLTRTVRGARFMIKVSVPGKGRISITGALIGSRARSVSSAGTYGIRVAITKTASRRLALGHTLRLRLQARYAPPAADAQAVRFTLTVEPAHRHRTRHTRRATRRHTGGAR